MALPMDIELGVGPGHSVFISSASSCEKHDIKTDRSTLSLAFPSSVDPWIRAANGRCCEWYVRWFNERLETLPLGLASHLRDFTEISKEVAAGAKIPESLSTIADALLDRGLVSSSSASEARQAAMSIVFAIIGWQSMLYQAELCDWKSGNLAIADILDGYHSRSFFRFRIDRPDVDRLPSELLLNFGLMLPAGNICASDDPDDINAFEKVEIVRPGEFNVALLCSIADINIKWVEYIAPHLEFDQATNTVFLFRWPSFCLANAVQCEKLAESVIHSLGTTDDNSGQWASRHEVTQLMKEIVLSYRILFGQDKASRKFFRSLSLDRNVDRQDVDELLFQLCGAKSIEDRLICEDRDAYRLSRDFPILRQRIAILQSQLKNVKPRGFRAMWKDRRDSVQWYTFWAVILFGGTGVVLGIIQTVMQTIQTFQ